jgi:hypothetical protein
LEWVDVAHSPLQYLKFNLGETPKYYGANGFFYDLRVRWDAQSFKGDLQKIKDY